MYKLIAYNYKGHKRRVLAWSYKLMRLYQIRKRWPNCKQVYYVHVVRGNEEVV